MGPRSGRDLGPSARALLGDAELQPVGVDDDVAVLSATGQPGRLVLLARPHRAPRLADEAARLRWLGRRGSSPELLADGRADDGADVVVLGLAADATPATDGHPLGPEAMIETIARGLRDLHDIDTAACPFEASSTTLRARAAARRVDVASTGPYAGRSPEELLAIHEQLDEPLGDGTVFIHGRLRAERIWFAPDGSMVFTGWHDAGVGDPHVDLAAAAAIVTALHGPALVAPMLAAYGLDRIDLRRLDAAQLLVHLLG